MSGVPVILKEIARSGLSKWDALPFLRKVTDIVPNVIYIFNQKTQSNEYSNRSIGETLGYSDEEILQMGASMMPTLCHPGDMTKVAAHFADIKRLKDGEVAQIEYRMKGKSGEWVWLLSHDTVFDRDETGAVLRHIGVAANITAQKHAEEDARREHLKAAATNDELRAFSYSVSHDLKSPSNTLSLVLNELMECHGDSFDEDAKNLVNMALATAGRMGTMVDDVLNYTRVINQDVEAAPIELQSITENVLADLAALVQENNAVVTIGPLPEVMADKTQIRILLQNLIENAIKFHRPDCAPNVSVSAVSVPYQKRTSISISDNGIGIPANKHEQVFQIFKRLNGALEFSGSGLGLAICRRIAANHGRTIHLTSEPDKGAVFSIELPIV